MLGRRNQVTLPRECIPRGTVFFDCELKEDGSVVLTPQLTIPSRQAYFWTKRWQEGEKKASEDIREGRLGRHGSAESLAAHIERKRAR